MEPEWRQHGTEHAFVHPSYAEKTSAIYRCVCCGAALFSSADKFGPGTGWPSYTESIGCGALREHEDRSFLTRRTEVRCGCCDAHLGHLLLDGPEPADPRYCVNGLALQFRPETGENS